MKAKAEKTKTNPPYDCLVIPKDGHAPMLFLEWASESNSSFSSVRDDKERNVFVISLHSYSEEFYKSVAEYINLNL
jgi:hypothetical protein